MILVSCDPALVPLFTSPQPRLGRYEVCVLDEPLRPVNGGAVESLEALDAFGAAGTYDRSKLARRKKRRQGRIAGVGRRRGRFLSPRCR